MEVGAAGVSGANRCRCFHSSLPAYGEAPVFLATAPPTTVPAALTIHFVVATFAEHLVTPWATEQLVIAWTPTQLIRPGTPDQSIPEATGTATYLIVTASGMSLK